jgi:hypothetical protein
MAKFYICVMKIMVTNSLSNLSNMDNIVLPLTNNLVVFMHLVGPTCLFLTPCSCLLISTNLCPLTCFCSFVFILFLLHACLLPPTYFTMQIQQHKNKNKSSFPICFIKSRNLPLVFSLKYQVPSIHICLYVCLHVLLHLMCVLNLCSHLILFPSYLI